MAPESIAAPKASEPSQIDTASAASSNKNSQSSNSNSTMMAAPKSPPRAGTISRSNNPSSNTSTTPGGTKRTPYRRTKRKPGVDLKSTVTHTTDSALQHMNAFDMVLQESNDLMQAAMEAQQLGRLKMASTYLLLLHARLVGLGKRFDKAEQQEQQQQESKTASQERGDNNDEETNVAGLEMDMSEDDPVASSRKKAKLHEETLTSPPRLAARTSSQAHSMLPPQATPKSGNLHAKTTSADPPFVLATPKTAAAKQLAQMLPESIEMDQAMMEHLARAAAQLHAARSGKARRLHEQAVMRQQYMAAAAAQQSPGGTRTSTAGVASTTIPLPTIPSNQQAPGDTVATKTTTTAAKAASKANDANSASTTNAPNNAVSFTVKEYKLLHAAAQSGKPNHEELAKQTGRSEVQIKAFLRNLDTKNRILEDHLDILQDEEGSSGQQQQQQHQSKGRGRKPATTAINTVPNAVCDTRVLLQGNFLARNTAGANDDEAFAATTAKDAEEKDEHKASKQNTGQSKENGDGDDNNSGTKKGDSQDKPLAGKQRE